VTLDKQQIKENNTLDMEKNENNADNSVLLTANEVLITLK
jgi:hypothetical protein